MTPLEIGLLVALSLAVIVAVTVVWAARHRIGTADSRVRDRDARLAHARDRRADERDRRKAAQGKAARAFVRALQLEADLKRAAAAAAAARADADAAYAKAAACADRKFLGFRYSTKNEGVASVMLALQKTLGTFQESTCAASRAVFAQQKATVLAQLRQMPGPIKCADVTSTVATTAASAEQALREALPQGAAAATIAAEVKEVWGRVSSQVCNRNGVVDADMLGAFMDAVFDAICS